MIKSTFRLLSVLAGASALGVENINKTQKVSAAKDDKCPPDLAKCNRMFLYGTLKRGEPNHSFLEDQNNGVATFIASGRTRIQYPLVIASKYNLPFVLFERGLGHQIKGEIYEVDEKMLRVLDELEGHPHIYMRRCQDILVFDEDTKQERTVKCWMYFLVKYDPELLSLPYMETYSAGGNHGMIYVNKPDGSKVLIDDVTHIVKD